MANALQLKLEVFDDDYDTHDERWIEQVDDLHRELEREAGTITTNRIAVEGHKSGVAEVILALGSAGAISAAVQCFRMWLKHGRHRRIAASATIDGKTHEIVVDTEGMSAEAAERAFLQMLGSRQADDA